MFQLKKKNNLNSIDPSPLYVSKCKELVLQVELWSKKK